MGIESELGMELSIYRTMKSKILVELKSSKFKPFIAQVKEFIYEVDEDDKVVFERLEETIFPTDTSEEQSQTYVTAIKNIKELVRVK